MAAAALVVIFGAVVFSLPPEKLAWQGPYVMGTLLLPRPSPGAFVRPETMRDNADSAFSLLAFFSVVGIIGLCVRKVYTNRPGAGRLRRGSASRTPVAGKVPAGRAP